MPAVDLQDLYILDIPFGGLGCVLLISYLDNFFLQTHTF